jgi:hypothetical protein
LSPSQYPTAHQPRPKLILACLSPPNPLIKQFSIPSALKNPFGLLVWEYLLSPLPALYPPTLFDHHSSPVPIRNPNEDEEDRAADTQLESSRKNNVVAGKTP